MIIYKIINNINGKIYIGQTTRLLSDRWNDHKNLAIHGSNLHLYCSMRKYGIDNFSIEIIDTATSKEELNAKEIFWISYYNTTDLNSGYNNSYGGDINSMDFIPTRKKHKLSMMDDSVRNRISNKMREYRKNNPFTQETRKKISDKLQGNKNGLGKIRPISAVEATASAHRKHVYCVDKDGKVVKEFNSVKEAAEWVSSNRGFKSVRSGNRIIKRSFDKNVYIDGLKWIYK